MRKMLVNCSAISILGFWNQRTFSNWTWWNAMYAILYRNGDIIIFIICIFSIRFCILGFSRLRAFVGWTQFPSYTSANDINSDSSLNYCIEIDWIKSYNCLPFYSWISRVLSFSSLSFRLISKISYPLCRLWTIVTGQENYQIKCDNFIIIINGKGSLVLLTTKEDFSVDIIH